MPKNSSNRGRETVSERNEVLAAETSERTGLRKRVHENARQLVLGYPLAVLGLLFGIPMLFLVVATFFPKPSGGYYQVGFTLENYAELFSAPVEVPWLGPAFGVELPLYVWRLVFTVELAAATGFACLALGYPIAYSLSRMGSPMRRRVYITAIVSTMWLTYIIRSYAIGVILSKSGVLNRLLLGIGLIGEPVFSSKGILPVMLGMTYVFLPFAILSMYSSINNIDAELEEASKNLGANRLQTFRRVVLPLSKNGIYAAWMLVFILALGAYIVPSVLGTPSERTLPVVIGQIVRDQLNIPFASALAMMMLVVVIAILALGYKFMGLGSQDLTGGGPSGE